MDIKWKRVLHRGQKRITIDFPYNQDFANILRRDLDAKWSRTLRVWHMEDTQENIDKALLIIEKNKLNKKKQTYPTIVKTPTKQAPTIPKDIIIDIIGSKILVKMPKSDADIQFVTSIKYAKWIRDQFIWQIPHYGDNLDRIKKYFSGRIERFTEHTMHEVNINTTTTIQVKKDTLII